MGFSQPYSPGGNPPAEPVSPWNSSFDKLSQEELEAHLQVARYGDFFLTDAVRPAYDLKVVPTQGYRCGVYRDDENHVQVPVLMAAASREVLTSIPRPHATTSSSWNWPCGWASKPTTTCWPAAEKDGRARAITNPQPELPPLGPGFLLFVLAALDQNDVLTRAESSPADVLVGPLSGVIDLVGTEQLAVEPELHRAVAGDADVHLLRPIRAPMCLPRALFRSTRPLGSSVVWSIHRTGPTLPG